MDEETKKLIKEMCELLTGNTYETLSEGDYARLESLALFVGHSRDILDA